MVSHQRACDFLGFPIHVLVCSLWFPIYLFVISYGFLSIPCDFLCFPIHILVISYGFYLFLVIS